MDWLRSQPVVMQAFLAGFFTWGCTIVGSAIVFFFKSGQSQAAGYYDGLCGRGYDFRGGRGADTGFADQWQYRCGDFRSHGGLCSYDDFRCCFRIKDFRVSELLDSETF